MCFQYLKTKPLSKSLQIENKYNATNATVLKNTVAFVLKS